MYGELLDIIGAGKMSAALTDDEYGVVLTWCRDNSDLPMAQAFTAAHEAYVEWRTLRKQFARELRSKKASELKMAVFSVQEYAFRVRNQIGQMVLEMIKKDGSEK